MKKRCIEVLKYDRMFVDGWVLLAEKVSFGAYYLDSHLQLLMTFIIKIREVTELQIKWKKFQFRIRIYKMGCVNMNQLDDTAFALIFTRYL